MSIDAFKEASMKIIDDVGRPIPKVELSEDICLTNEARCDYIIYQLDLLCHEDQRDRELNESDHILAIVTLSLRKKGGQTRLPFGSIPISTIPRYPVSLQLLLEQQFNPARILTACALRTTSLKVYAVKKTIQVTLRINDVERTETFSSQAAAPFYVLSSGDTCL